MNRTIGAAAFALAAAAGALHAEDAVSMVFDEAHTNGSGWTFVNVRFHSDKTNNAYLSSSAGYIESPVFSSPVVHVGISFMASSASTRRLMRVVPLDANGEETDLEPLEFVPPLTAGVAEIAWDAEAGVRRFRIGASTGSGNIHVYGCSVELAEGDGAPPVPRGLENLKVKGNSFVAAWNACAGVESYLVDLYRVDAGASAWTGEALREDFDGAVNATGNPVEIKDVPALFPQLDGEKLYVPARTNGFIQIGTGDKAGFVALSGCPAAEGCAVRFRAKRYAHKYEGRVMPLLWTDGPSTNGFASVELGDEMADYEVPLDGVPAGSVVLLHSTTNKSTAASARGRVWLDSVSVVSGYSPAHAATNAVAESVAATATSRKFTGLRTGVSYLWRVRSVRGESVSEPTAFMEVVPEGDPERLGTTIVFR